MTEDIKVYKTGYTTVTIHTISIKENWVNNIEQYNAFLTEKRYLNGYEKFILNFLNLSRIVEVVGYIAKEQDGSTAANTLRYRLINIFKCNAGGGALCTVTTGASNWYGQNEGGTNGGVLGAMSGLEFRDVPADKNVPSFFLTTFSIIEGKVR